MSVFPKSTLFLLIVIFSLIGKPLLLVAQVLTINGAILDNKTGLRISNATITNRTNGAIVRTSELGIFRIQGKASDTLSVTKSGYTEYLVTITSGQDLVIRMQPVIRLLDVTVTGQTKKQELDEIKREFKKKSFYAGKPPVLAYVFHPITALYETFGKEPNQAKRFNNYYRTELEETEINKRFNSTLITELTNFGDKDLQNFIETYRPSYNSISTWDDYELIKYIKTSAETFNKTGRPASFIKSLPKLPPAPDLSEKEIKLKKLKY